MFSSAEPRVARQWFVFFISAGESFLHLEWIFMPSFESTLKTCNCENLKAKHPPLKASLKRQKTFSKLKQ